MSGMTKRSIDPQLWEELTRAGERSVANVATPSIIGSLQSIHLQAGHVFLIGMFRGVTKTIVEVSKRDHLSLVEDNLVAIVRRVVRRAGQPINADGTPYHHDIRRPGQPAGTARR
jgi:predicted YcjX-like family ATPase